MSSTKPVIGFEDSLANNYQEYAPTMYAIGKMRAARTPYDYDTTVIQDANKLYKPGLYVMTQGTTNVVPSYTLTSSDVCFIYNLLPDPDDSLLGGHTKDTSIHRVPTHVRQIAYLYINGEATVQTRIGVKSEDILTTNNATIQHISEVATLTASASWVYRFVYELGYWIRYKTVNGRNVWEPALTWTDWTAFGGSSGSSTPSHNPVEFVASSITAQANTIYVSFASNTVTLPPPEALELGDTIRVDQWLANGAIANFNGATIETTPRQINIGSTDFTWNDEFNQFVQNTIFYDNSDGSWTATVGSYVFTIRKNSAGAFALTASDGTLIAVKELANATYPWSENTAGKNNWTFQSPARVGNVTMERGIANLGCNTYEFEVTYDGYYADASHKAWIQKNNGGNTTVTTYDFNNHNGVQLGYNGDKLTVSATSASPSVPGTVMTTHTLSRMASNAVGYNNTVPSVTATFNAISLVSSSLAAVSSAVNSHIINHPSGGGGTVTLEGLGVIDATPLGENNYEIGLNWSSTITNGVQLSKTDDALVARGVVAAIGVPGVVRTVNTLDAVEATVNVYTVPTVNTVSNAVGLVSSYAHLVSTNVSGLTSTVNGLATNMTLVSEYIDEVSEAFRITSYDYTQVSATFTDVSAVVSELVAGGGGGGGGTIDLGLPLYYSGTVATISGTYATRHSGVTLISAADGALRAIGIPATGTFTSAADGFGVVKTISSIPTNAMFNSADGYTDMTGNPTTVTNPGDKYVVPTVRAVQSYVAAMNYNGPFTVRLVDANTVSVGGDPLDNDNNVAGRMYYKADASCVMQTASLEFTGAGPHEVYAYLYYNGTGYTSGYAVDNANIPADAKDSQGTYRLIAKFSGTTVCQTQYGDIVFPARW